MPKKVLIALPPTLIEQIDYVAGCEHRTRSDLIREALRRYLAAFRRDHGPDAIPVSVPAIKTEPTFAKTPAPQEPAPAPAPVAPQHRVALIGEPPEPTAIAFVGMPRTPKLYE